MTMAAVRTAEASTAPVQQTTPVEEWAPAWWNGTKTQNFSKHLRKDIQIQMEVTRDVARNRFKLCPGVSDLGALPADVSS